MKVHRFYVGPELPLAQDLWLHDPRLVHQLGRVLRVKPGEQIVLFNDQHEKLYEITEVHADEIRAIHKTDLDHRRPGTDLYLFWGLLKKDKNDWVLQKGTELGVSHFVPLLAERSEKTGFNLERAQKIITEAAEQCGRGDIPTVREPMHVWTALEQYHSKLSLIVCQQSEASSQIKVDHKIGAMVGPEGGWSPAELKMFTDLQLPSLNLHDFTLRAETAAVVAASKLLQ